LAINLANPQHKQPNSPTPTRALRPIAWAVIVVFGVLLTSASIYYAVNNLAFRTARSDLVSRDLRLIRLSDQMEKEFGSRDQFMVVLESGDRSTPIAFAQALANELNKYPERFPELFYRVDPNPFRQWALLYLEPEELRDVKEKLLDHRREMAAMAADPSLNRFFQVVNEEITRSMIGHLFTSFLEEEDEKDRIPDLALLNASLNQLHLTLSEGKPYRSVFSSLFPGDLGDFKEEGYFFTENDKYLLFLVTPEEDGFSTSAGNLQLLREVVDKVKQGFPGLKVGVTGPSALSDDEMTGALSDMTLATWLSLLFQLVLLILFFRSFKRPLVESLVLIIGLSWTFGAATLIVGHLNILSMIFAPLILGMTIDYGIHWYSHLEEEQGSKKSWTPEVLKHNLGKVAPGVLIAGLASSASLVPLVFTGFKGLAELGLILAVGIPLMALATLLLLPSLMVVTEKRRMNHNNEPEPPGQPKAFMSLQWRRPGLIVALGAVIIVLGGISLPYVPFDLNPLNLQNQETESVVWELKLIKGSKYSSSYGTMVACCLDELPAKVGTLKKLDTVSHVESILSFLPENVDAKRPILQDLKPVVTKIDFPADPIPSDIKELGAILGRIRFKLSEVKDSDWKPEHKPTQRQLDEANYYLDLLAPLLKQGNNPQLAARLAAFEKEFFGDLKDKWDLLKENVTTTTLPGIDDLPLQVRQRFISPSGTYLIRTFPSQDIWDPKPLGLFVKDLQSVDPNVVGDPVLLYYFNQAFRDACLWAAGMGILAVLLILIFVMRSFKLTFLAIIPLTVGTALTLCMMWLLDVAFNQANVLFLPLILGEAVEYGIFIIVRWKKEESARAITLPASTAKGVMLSALTTAFGFGILMISGHRGVFSLGLLAALGSLSVLLAALSVMPAFLRLVERDKKAAAQPAANHLQGLRRWLSQTVKKEAQ
jgi:hopanoid biosynthesis associated RND transporter like protein HpnN